MRTIGKLITTTPAQRSEFSECSPETLATIAGRPERRRPCRSASSLLTLEPQLLPGEQLAPEESTVAERVLREKLRADDQFWVNRDGPFFVVLANCSPDNARVVAQRLGAEVTLRASSVRNRNWSATVAGYARECSAIAGYDAIRSARPAAAFSLAL